MAAAVELRPVHDRVLAFGEPADGHLGGAAIVVRPVHVLVACFTPTVAPYSEAIFELCEERLGMRAGARARAAPTESG
jgi:hypothetical protein